MSHVVTVTGATGNIGGALSRELARRGVRVRAVARHAGRLEALGAGIEPRAGSLEDLSFMARAMEGAAAAFLMVPPRYDEADFRAYQRRVGEALATGVESAGVPRVVTLSSVGADRESGTGPIAGLHELEKRLERISGLHVLHLRPTYFMENELAAIGAIRAMGAVASALEADRPLSRVATRDIAAVAAEVLAQPTFTGRAFRELLGPRDPTPREATRILGASIGRPDLPYLQLGYEEMRKALSGAGMSDDLARLYVEMTEALNEGRVRPLQGRGPDTTTPTTLETFAAEVFAPAFRA